ncbi:EAL domain-containing protein [Vibrio diazotrophicus]|uniref:EAL domain-containing protein n=1 Tax=Vibrio diazotrophicus TaxID=685 RepID=UPI00142D4FEA|nr:EAL domain-containing protein [Vibrio diazotrophicus]NIY93106.1 EAL domain-containing protein [Vibrio diazotrophicus]
MSDGRFVYADDSSRSMSLNSIEYQVQPSWKVLTVDDDKGYQQSLIYSLNDLEVNGRSVEVLSANSATEAAYILSQHNDIALILLDVVMEQDDAGLRLVETVRNVQGNSLVRIILLTGQPGFAPRKDVMLQYDINEYWNKSEVDHETLKSITVANFRSWQSMIELDKARMGLQLLVDASRKIASKYDANTFIQVVIKEIVGLFGGFGEPSLCVLRVDKAMNCEQALVVASSGVTGVEQGEPLPDEIKLKFVKLCRESIAEKNHKFQNNLSVLYFSGDSDGSYYYLVLAETKQCLSDYHIRLLQVFSENISSGFMQIALVNQLSKLAYQDSDLNVKNKNWLLRELDVMNQDELSELEMLVVELDDYDTHAISFDRQSLMALIGSVCQRLVDAFHTSSVVSRVGSDRFAILHSRGFALTDDELISLSSLPHSVGEFQVRCTLTFARVELKQLANYPAQQILHMARSLLCSARDKKMQVVTYEPSYRESLIRDYQILGDLKSAIESKEFYIVLQPKCDLKTGRAVGLEALLRWKKQETTIPPNIFIPIAERSGLINKLDTIAAKLTFEALHRLEDAGYSLPTSINATVQDLTDPEYIALLLDLVRGENLNPDLIEVEITESQTMESYLEIKPILDHLHNAGIKISIDDFGTGYSSLSHISQLGVDTIKIDISFVRHLHEDMASQQVVDLVVSLAGLFDFSVVAEGVETDEQRNALLERGCTLGQGYLYARPMMVDELLVWLKNNESELSE